MAESGVSAVLNNVNNRNEHEDLSRSEGQTTEKGMKSSTLMRLSLQI